jgi:hypothetical protein
LNREDHSDDLGVDGRIISECILRKYGEKLWTGLIKFRIKPVAGYCQHGNELPCPIKRGGFS